MSFGGVFDLTGLRHRHEELETQMARPDLWDDREKAEAISRDKSALEAELQIYDRLESSIDDAGVLLELANEADDVETRGEAAAKCDEIREALEEIELHQLLGGTHDNSPVILSINSGAGGPSNIGA